MASGSLPLQSLTHWALVEENCTDILNVLVLISIILDYIPKKWQ